MWQENKNIEQPLSPEPNGEQTYNVFTNDGAIIANSARQIVESQKEADAKVESSNKDLRQAMIKDFRSSGGDWFHESKATRKIGHRLNEDAAFAEQVKQSAHAISPDMIEEAKQEMEATTDLKFNGGELGYGFKSSSGQIEYLSHAEVKARLHKAEEEAAFQQQQYEKAMANPTNDDEFEIEVIKMRKKKATADVNTLREIIITQRPEMNE